MRIDSWEPEIRGARGQRVNGLGQQNGPDLDEALLECGRVFAGSDRDLDRAQHVAGVHPLVQTHGRHAGQGLAPRQSPLDGGRAPQPGQEGEVDVDRAVGGDIEHRSRSGRASASRARNRGPRAVFGSTTSRPSARARALTGVGRGSAERPTGRSGRVTTSGTS